MQYSDARVGVDLDTQQLTHRVKTGPMPADVFVTPDDKHLLLGLTGGDGVEVYDVAGGKAPELVKKIATGKGAHGLYVSRDSREMYVSNRGEGTISIFDFARNKLTKKWVLPGGGSPDMGGVSTDDDGQWLSRRYDAEVYAIDTRTGKGLARIPVGSGPHGLAVYPQPGRYSLGHTGVFR